MGNKAYIPAHIKNSVMSDFSCCAACGTWDADECGHIIPESKGGAMVVSNFVRLCGSCNRSQANKSVVFVAFASYTESPALIRSRRAYWAKYLGAIKIALPYKPS